ncbi:MAG: LysR family transcriptional regulator [Zavarzinia sp.]|nr:LysR family transcriptional regulator [Zavarzinia sp.]
MSKFEEMQVFATAVRLGGFSAAGRQLDLSPSAVSKLVTRLEARLGVRLVNRTTRAVSPTEAGQQFFERCQDILGQVEAAEDALSDHGRSPKGTLRISSTPGFAQHRLLPLLADFQAHHPSLRLELQLTGQAIDLVAERVDLAIRLGPLKETSLIARPLGESRRQVCAAPAYLARHGIPRVPEDLRGHNCLRLSTSRDFNQWHFHGPAGETLIEVEGNFVTDNVEALYGYALQGGGIVRLSSFMVRQAIDDGRLVPLLQPFEMARQQIHLVYPHRRHLAPKVRVFVDFLLAAYGGDPPWDRVS